MLSQLTGDFNNFKKILTFFQKVLDFFSGMYYNNIRT